VSMMVLIMVFRFYARSRASDCGARPTSVGTPPP
jgi:hypothetical protein